MNPIYTVTLKDGTSIIARSGALQQATENAMVNGTPVRINGEVISGAIIGRVRSGAHTGEYGPHLTSGGESYLEIDSGDPRPSSARNLALDAKLSMIRETLSAKTGEGTGFSEKVRAYAEETEKYRANGKQATEEQIKRINGI